MYFINYLLTFCNSHIFQNICDRQAVYVCGDCNLISYCSNEHRMQHWRAHKEQCKSIKNFQQIKQQKQFQSHRLAYRKQYFEMFSNKIYDQALTIAKQLLILQKQHIQITRYIQNQFQYGISICLLCRTYIILGKLNQAKIQIFQYLKQKQHFLQDMRDICKYSYLIGYEDDREDKSNSNKQKQNAYAGKQKQKVYNVPVTQKSKEFLKKKLELISTVANIFYSLKLPPLPYYTMYLNHIEFAFGAQSLEASNCYFLIGTYYMQERQFNKSIACFVRAAQLRGSKGGDCYYNLAIIYQIRDKYDVAIKMFQQSVKLLQQRAGQNSEEIAIIHQQIAQIMIKKNDFNSGIKSLQKALKIYATKDEQKFEKIKQKIKMLHEFIKIILEQQDKSLLPKQIQDQLVDKKIKQIKNLNQLKAQQLSFAEERKQNKDRSILDNLLKLPQNFLSRLNPLEIYRLSELQLELEKCNSQFAVAYIVANSQFMKRLGENRLKEMKLENEKLFELMNIEKRFDLGISGPINQNNNNQSDLNKLLIG